MPTNPLVSIVIPVFNRENFIVDVINSCINQEYNNIEIIIIDNNSTDNTVEIIKKIYESNENIKLFKNEENIGPIKNWKKGALLAKGKYVKILFSDDYINKKYITRGVESLESDKELGFYCTGTLIKNKNKILKRNRYFKKHGINNANEFIERILLGGNISVSASHALFRKEDILTSFVTEIPNKINSDFNMHGIGPDALMFLNILINYEVFFFDSEYLTIYNSHEDSISVGTNDSKLILLHLLGRAFFVENRLSNRKLIEKFNSRILINLKRHASISALGLNEVNDFYLNESITHFNHFYSLKYYWEIIFKYRIRQTLKKILRKNYQL